MPNLYNQPAQAQFINTYIPIPFEEITQAGLARQNRYDTNINAFEQSIAEAESLPAIPGSIDEQYVKQSVENMRSIADEYADKDYSNPEVIREISRKVRSNVDRHKLNDIIQSYQGYKEYNKILNKLHTEGRAIPSLNQSFIGYNTDESGVFSGSPEAMLDWQKTTKEFFNDVDYSSQGIMNIGNGMGIMRHARTPEALKQHAINNIDIWLQTPAGNQKVRELKAQGVNGTDEEIALSFLLPQAEEFVAYKDSQPFKLNTQDQSVFGGYSVEKFLPTEKIPDKYHNVKKAQKEIKHITSDIVDLEDIISQSDDIRKVENAKIQLKEKRKEQEKIENAVKWAEIEANSKYLNKELEIMSSFGNEDLPYSISPDSAYIGHPEYRKQINELDKLKIDYAQNLLNEYGMNSEGESINTVPTTYVGRDEYGNLSGKTVFSGEKTGVDTKFANIISDIMTDPDVDERIVKPVGIKDDRLKKFKNAKSLYVDGVSNPSDKGGSFIAVTAFDENRKGNKEKIGSYKIYLNTPTQLQAVAEVYLNENNIRDGARWLRPDIEQTVQNNIEGGGVNSFIIPIDQNESITANRKSNGNYILTIESTGEKSRELNPSEISEYIYINLF